MSRDAVIVDAVRTPIGRRGGWLAGVHPVDLSATVLRALAERNALDPTLIDDVIWGCVGTVGDQAANIGRQAVLAAGWPVSVPGTTVDRQCGSGQQAVHFAAAGVVSGQYDIAIAGGVESMSRVPMGSTRQTGDPIGATVRDRFGVETFDQGTAAELIAREWGLGRERLDAFAARSHARAAAAEDSGAFDDQMVHVPGVSVRFGDEGVRRSTSVAALAELRPAFQPDGVVTAGNASQISDGSAALLVTTSQMARRYGWRPLARVHSTALAGDDPVAMLTAPIPATRRVLGKAGLKLDDMSLIEVNEAFASVPLAWQAETGADFSRLNVLGGAIATGHPLGASGAVLMTRLVHHLRHTGGGYGLQVMCEAGGTANATIVESC